MNSESNPVDLAPSKLQKPYTSPVLTEYGDIRKITENVGGKGISDNHGNAKTGAGA